MIKAFVDKATRRSPPANITGAGSRIRASVCSCRAEPSRKELITSVVAGKSFSLAANIQGQMFAWGAGWAGQLGLGVAKDSRVSLLWPASVFLGKGRGGRAYLPRASPCAERTCLKNALSNVPSLPRCDCGALIPADGTHIQEQVEQYTHG